VKHLPRKALGNKWSQPKREATWAANNKAIVTGQPKTARGHITAPCAQDIGYGAIGFSVCFAGFWSCLGPFLFFFFLWYLGFELKVSCLISKHSNHLSHYASPFHFSLFPFFPFGIRMFALYHCILKLCHFLLDFTVAHTAKSLP
jgi:hypothetical protein